MTAVDLTERIKAYARSVGFDAVGVAKAEPFSDDRRVTQERIEAGHYSGLSWFSSERAAVASDPRNLLPSALSIISVAMSYKGSPIPLTPFPSGRGSNEDPRGEAQPLPAPLSPPAFRSFSPEKAKGNDALGRGEDESALAQNGGLRGRISAYAWGQDYHTVLKERMEMVVAYIREECGESQAARTLVDTARIMDRAAARRAGVGWVGKHTNVITKDAGSWVFLGEILTELELTPDVPLRTNCGTCDLCMRACPTGAISAPYVVESDRCISYLTIEHRGVIAHELRPLMGNWIFGCDICQEVCPPNQRVGAPAHNEFGAARAGDAAPELVPLLRITSEEFKERFGNTPVKRAKREGLQRNVAIALGNSGDRAVVPALAEALVHEAPLVRAHAAWALGRLGGDEAVEALRGALLEEQDELVRLEIEAALGELGLL